MSAATILLVDDEKTILDSLKGQLRSGFGARFRYETAENVTEAWEVIDDLEEDGVQLVVIVSDWLMPGVRGDEFLADVRRRMPHTVRVMLTGQADPAAIRRAYDEAAVQAVLRKPWSIREIFEVIEAGLGAAPEA